MQERIYSKEAVNGICGVRSPFMPFEAMPDDRCNLTIVLDENAIEGRPMIRDSKNGSYISGWGILIQDESRYGFGYDATIMEGERTPAEFSINLDSDAEQKNNLKKNLWGNSKEYKRIFQDLHDSIELSVVKVLSGDPVKLERSDDGSCKVIAYGQEIGTIEVSDVIDSIKEAVYQAVNYDEIDLTSDDTNVSNGFIGDCAEDFSERYAGEFGLNALQKFALQEEFHQNFWGDAVEVLEEARHFQTKEMSCDRELS